MIVGVGWVIGLLGLLLAWIVRRNIPAAAPIISAPTCHLRIARDPVAVPVGPGLGLSWI